MHLNKVTIIGCVGKGLKVTYSEQAIPTCHFWVQVDEVVKDKTYMTYIPCEISGKNAEDAAERLQEGQEVCIDGKLKYRSTVGKDGKKTGGLVVTSWYVTQAKPVQPAGESPN